MGQRLNIEITDNGDVLANAYYHWAAYTGSSISLTKDILDNFRVNPDNSDLRLSAIRLLESTGAGFNTQELEKARVLYPNEGLQPASHRNFGLLSISEKGMEETRSWEEGRVTIDIRNKKVDFEVYFRLDFADYERDYEEDPSKLPLIEFDFHEIAFDDFYKLDELYTTMEKEGNYDFLVKGEETELVYGFIA